MKRIFDILKIRREECWPALFMLLIFTALNALVIYKYYSIFTPIGGKYWPLFIHNFHLSGFDPITYAVVSDWSAGYNVYRHPLLAFYMFIPYLLNQGLMWLTGINCAIFIVAAIQIFCALYAFLFLFRILREIVGVHYFDALLLSFFFFSFAFVILSAMAPDHFIISLMLLLIVLYISGCRMKHHHPFRTWQGFVYFLLIAGTSLNNGVKVFLSGLFVNGLHFFRPKYLLLAVLLPAALLWGFSKWEYATFVWPVEVARHAAKAQRLAENKAHDASMQSTKVDMTTAMKATKNNAGTTTLYEQNHKKKNKVTPISNEGFMKWTDISTPRMASIVENLFGESIQLHRDYLLQDEYHTRPMIVHYRQTFNYVVEGIIVLLFIMGIVCSRRDRFLWLVLSYFAIDMLLHLGLGFGLCEVYIMATHWIYVIPIAIAYLLCALSDGFKPGLRVLLMLLTFYLAGYNIAQICTYLLA